MTTPNDGGPAFPSGVGKDANGLIAFGDEYGHGGMSLRDWFAGMAMQAILSKSGRDMPGMGETDQGPVFHPPTVADWAYCYADEMLKEKAGHQ